MGGVPLNQIDEVIEALRLLRDAGATDAWCPEGKLLVWPRVQVTKAVDKRLVDLKFYDEVGNKGIGFAHEQTWGREDWT